MNTITETIAKKDDQRNGVLFVTSVGEVANYLTNLFTNPNLPLHKDYLVLGSSPNREAAIARCEKDRPKLVFFFEKTAGITSISETVYKLRLTGARVLYVSSQRMVGDLVLEALVHYGVYDLILDEALDPKKILDYVYNPREFRDVSAFCRYTRVADSGAGAQSFELPDLQYIRQFSTRLESDYLTDPVSAAVEGMGNRVSDPGANQGIAGRLFAGQPVQKKPVRQQIQQPTPAVQQSNFGLGDLDLDF